MNEIGDIREHYFEHFNEWPINGAHQTWIQNVCQDANKGAKDCRTLLEKVDALQAKIDMLMLEWCPEEMSEEQKANWERHQVRVSPEEQAEIEKALEQL